MSFGTGAGGCLQRSSKSIYNSSLALGSVQLNESLNVHPRLVCHTAESPFMFNADAHSITSAEGLTQHSALLTRRLSFQLVLCKSRPTPTHWTSRLIADHLRERDLQFLFVQTRLRQRNGFWKACCHCSGLGRMGEAVDESPGLSSQEKEVSPAANGDSQHQPAQSPREKPSIWRKTYILCSWTPPNCRYDPNKPFKFSMWLNILFGMPSATLKLSNC